MIVAFARTVRGSSDSGLRACPLGGARSSDLILPSLISRRQTSLSIFCKAAIDGSALATAACFQTPRPKAGSPSVRQPQPESVRHLFKPATAHRTSANSVSNASYSSKTKPGSASSP